MKEALNMAKLITQLNKTTGNLQDVFIFTLNASFNGIQDKIENAQIQIFFPDSLTIYLGDIQDPIKNVTQSATSNGTLYTFNFGSITDVGIAVRIGIRAMFTTGTPNETMISITPELWINETFYTTAASESIQLIIIPNFVISNELLLPQIAPAPGSVIYYRVILKNFGDLGGLIRNIRMVCSHSDEFQIDSSYPIRGKDVSSKGFEDLSQDNVSGQIIDGSLYFDLEQFYGEAYEFIYRVLVSEDVSIDSEYASTLSWSIDNIPQTDLQTSTSIGAKIYKTNFSLYGPDYSLPNKLINYESRLSNTGNQELNDLTLTIELPQDVTFSTFTTGLFSLYGLDETLDLDYRISYTTISGVTGIVGNYNTNSNTTISITDTIGVSESLSTLTWEFSTFPIGIITKSTPLFNGRIRESMTIGSVILCNLSISYYANNTSSSNQTNQLTMLQDVSVLTPTFSSSIGSTPVRPSETFQYTIGANCRSSRLDSPVFLVLLPQELIFTGNVTSNFYDYFRGSTAILVPEPLIIPNFNENSDTLLIFAFTEDSYAEFNQKARIRLTFSVQVRATARGDFSTFFLMDSLDSNGQIPANRQIYTDSKEEFSPYTSNSNQSYAQSNISKTSILFFVSISTHKEVKGFLDDNFQDENTLGSTLAGEEILYKITLTNTGNADLDAIEFVDILPYIGDTGVIETSISRESQFPVILTSEVSARSSNTVAPESSDSVVDFDIFYSSSKDPLRFGSNFDLIGSEDNWTPNPPDVLHNIHAIKVRTAGTPLLPGHTLTILYKALATIGVSENVIAWNSFASDVTYTDTQGEAQHLLAVEPNKVGVQIATTDSSKGNISGFVFWDSEKNGMFTSKTQHIELTNDIGVVLYNNQGIPLRTTFTSSTTDQVPGHYVFSNLAIGQYYLRFFIDTNVHDFSIQRLDTSLGNIANKHGITPLLDLTLRPSLENVIAGIRSNTDRHIENILNVNRSSNQLLRSVIMDQMLIGMKHEDVIEVIMNKD